MIQLRKSSDRGLTKLDWLESYHSFSFGNYYDPDQMGYGVLRVINDDLVEPGAGFGTHSHHNMEIITFVLKGKLEHKDSIGNGSIIQAGDVQRMSAGSGITHSEFNASNEEVVRFLQIWVIPRTKNQKPSYEQRSFPVKEKLSQLRLVVSSDGDEGSISVDQDVKIYASIMNESSPSQLFEVPDGRSAWIQVANGKFQVNGVSISEGDGLLITEAMKLEIMPENDGEFFLFDLANL